MTNPDTKASLNTKTIEIENKYLMKQPLLLLSSSIDYQKYDLMQESKKQQKIFQVKFKQKLLLK